MLGNELFAGSENLYKYLVSIGMLLIVLTVYYPLKEKQELELSKIELEGEVKILNYRIKENIEKLSILQPLIETNGMDDTHRESLSVIANMNYENHIHHLECERKNAEINAKQRHICLYNILFWAFLPVGIAITIFGFCRWYKQQVKDDTTKR